ncbi:MAG TPA: DNA gyrase inhibitor YacG [Acidobacteriota bacterium]
MRCPNCRKQVSREDPYFPFCSERCKLVDLDKWLSGDYVVPGKDGEHQPGNDQPEQKRKPDDQK